MSALGCEQIYFICHLVFFYVYRSEANDLALRLAKAHTKKEDIVVVQK